MSMIEKKRCGTFYKNRYVTKTPFGTLDDGREISLYTLTNKAGNSVKIMDLGATIVALNVPDRNGSVDDITLGFDKPQPYLTDSPYFGAIVGRYVNRIANGKFSLDGSNYVLAINNKPNALHGGTTGFDKRLWSVEVLEAETEAKVRFTLFSENGDEGYPGNLKVHVTYTFGMDNQLCVAYEATTDQATVINLSQHAYFNLNGHASGDILDHELMLNAAHYTPVDATLIPTGEVEPVAGSPMDFITAKKIGADIDAGTGQLKFGLGYDHNWVLSKNNAEEEVQLAAVLYAPESGRTMAVYTDQPGIQFYAGNFLDGSIVGKDGAVYHHRNGLCLETQHFPDSPNQPNFPFTVLKLGEAYRTSTVFKFGASRASAYFSRIHW